MKRRCKLYYTSDVHGYLFPAAYQERGEQPTGLLNCISNFEKDGNTLILDGGDTIQGSPMIAYLNGHPPVEGLCRENPVGMVYNAGKYDAFTLGNHDFNFGYERLKNHIRGNRASCLCANVTDRRHELGIIPSRVYVMENGLRVGVAGIVTDHVNIWEQPDHLVDLIVSEPFAAAKREYERLRPETDVIICVYHGGYECDLTTGEMLSDTGENVGYKICRELGYDVLLTGHQHMRTEGSYVCGTYTLQLPANAAEYAQVEISCEDGQIFIDSEICPAGNVHAEEPYGTLLPLEHAVQDWLDEKIGELAEEIPVSNKLDMALQGSRIADFFNQIQLEYSGADISCVGLGNAPMGMNREVTMRDLVTVYPFSNTMVVLEVDEACLRNALERCAEYFTLRDGRAEISDAFLVPKVEHYNYDFFAGISYEFDISRPVGSRVTKLFYKGRPLAGRRLKLCMSDYRASGTGGYECYRGCRVIERIGVEVPQIALEYLKAQGKVEISVRSECSVVW